MDPGYRAMPGAAARVEVETAVSCSSKYSAMAIRAFLLIPPSRISYKGVATSMVYSNGNVFAEFKSMRTRPTVSVVRCQFSRGRS